MRPAKERVMQTADFMLDAKQLLSRFQVGDDIKSVLMLVVLLRNEALVA